MQRLIVVGLLIVTATAGYGQRRGGGGGGYGQGNILNPSGTSPGGSFGQGNILNPSGVRPGPMVPPPNGLGNMVSTYPPHGPGRVGDGYGRGMGHQRTVVVPYAVPVWTGPGYGYYGDPYYGTGQQPSTNVTVVMPQQPTPQVIINQSFSPDVAHPVLKDYSDADLPEPSASLRIYDAPASGQSEEPKTARKAPRVRTEAAAPAADDKPTIYLIALKDASVRAAIGYWSEKGGTLGYVTPQGSINHVSLDMLDRSTTDQLNRERGLEFDLR